MDRSVFITLLTYNRPVKCLNTINQILAQNHTNWFLLIIDDGSTNENYDELSQYVEKINSNKIKLHRNESNMKIPESLNTGIKYFLTSNYQYFTWIADDNYMYDNFLTTLVTSCEDYCYAPILIFFNISDGHCGKTRGDYANHHDIINSFQGNAAFMWSKNATKRVGYYNPDLFMCEDYEYMLRTFLAECKIKYVDTIVMDYDYHKDSIYFNNEAYIRQLTRNVNKKYMDRVNNDEKLLVYYTNEPFSRTLQRINRIDSFFKTQDRKMFLSCDCTYDYIHEHCIELIPFIDPDIRNIIKTFSNVIIYYNDYNLCDEVHLLGESISQCTIFFDLIRDVTWCDSIESSSPSLSDPQSDPEQAMRLDKINKINELKENLQNCAIRANVVAYDSPVFSEYLKLDNINIIMHDCVDKMEIANDDDKSVVSYLDEVGKKFVDNDDMNTSSVIYDGLYSKKIPNRDIKYYGKRILMLIDAYGWVFDNICRTIRRYAKNKYEINIATSASFFNDIQNDIAKYGYDKIIMFCYGGDNRYILDFFHTKSIPVYLAIYDYSVWVNNSDKHKERVYKNCINHFFSKISGYMYSSFHTLEHIKINIPNSQNVLGYKCYDGVDIEKFYFQKYWNDIRTKPALVIGWIGNSDLRAHGVNKGYINIKRVIENMKDKFVFRPLDASSNKIQHDEVPVYLRDIDIIVSFSSYEGTPNQILEASSSGKCWVSTDVGIVSELFNTLENNPTGIIIKRDEQELINALLKLYFDRELIITYGENGRRAVENKWDWKDRADQFFTIFDL
jgi:glycosyltransferase involved in cell wall biosynthesis